MRIKSRSVTEILVGLHRVGLIGLQEAFRKAAESGLEERDGLLAVMMEVLTRVNYIPPVSMEDYRQAVWREFQRHRGRDISHLYSEIAVVVRGEPGPQLDRFLEIVPVVFAQHELHPVVTLEAGDAQALYPQLLIDERIVFAGRPDRQRMAKAIGRRIGDW